MPYPIFDLHCDLLFYLAGDPARSLNDPTPRCSLPQLDAGGVEKQVLAIYAETTPGSEEGGRKQLEVFQRLNKEHPNRFLPAIENASAFCAENEPLTAGLDRLEACFAKVQPLYMSLTWNGENRFGGGCGSDTGLSPDGQILLQFLSGRGVAIDLSHASDPLARDILNYIDKHNLLLQVLASHCNFRMVHNHMRNLPDDIAKEIIARDGLIGLVFYAEFLKEPAQLAEHIAHGIALGGEKALAFGADFFSTEDLSPPLPPPIFHPEMANASAYPTILEKLPFSKETLEAISSKNALSFLLTGRQQWV